MVTMCCASRVSAAIRWIEMTPLSSPTAIIYVPATTDYVFATAGRDKSVKIWQKSEETFVCKTTVALASAVSAIAFLHATYKGTYIIGRNLL
jgi:hypothetical protein